MHEITPGQYCSGCDQEPGCGFHDATSQPYLCLHHYCDDGREYLVSAIHKNRYHLDEEGFALIWGGGITGAFRISLETGQVFQKESNVLIPVGITLSL